MKNLQGYGMIMGAAVLWGASATLAKFLLNQQLDTLLLVQTRAGFSCLLMALYFSVFSPHLFRVSPSDLWRFALLGVLGLAGANFCYYFTIKESSVATAITIQYTAPLFIMTFEVLRKEESYSAVKLIAALLSLTGCFLTVTGFDLTVMRITPIGLLTGIGSIFAFAFLTIYVRRMLVQYSVWTVTFYYIMFASIFWFFVYPPWNAGTHTYSAGTWGVLLLLAIASVLVPNLLYSGGLRYLVPSRAVITSTLEPVVAIVTAAVFLGEVINTVQTFGAALVILAIIILQLSQEKTATVIGRSNGTK